MSEEIANNEDRNKHYHWFVLQGEITLYSHYPYLFIKLDSEEKEFCAFDKKDTVEIIQIMTTLTRYIWEDGGKQNSKSVRSLEDILKSNYQWGCPEGILALGFNHDSGIVGIRLIGEGSECRLTIEQAVELTQVLELFSANRLPH